MKLDSHRPRRCQGAAAMASIAMLVVWASASMAEAAPGWSQPVPLSPPIGLLNLQVEVSVALDPVENALAVWNANGIIQAAFQARGGAWSAATDVSRPADYEDTYEPQAVVGPVGMSLSALGTSMAIWTSSTAIPHQPRINAIKVSLRERNGAWATPVAVTTSTTAGLDSPRLALDVQGNAIAVWHSTTAGRGVIQAATKPNAGAWSQPVTLSSLTGDSSFPQVALNPLGQAAVVWQASDPAGNPTVVQAASKSPAGGWSAAVDVSSPTPQTWSPHVAIDGVGRAVAVWNQASVIMAAARSPRGGWSEPTALSSPGIPSYGAPAVAMDQDGNAIAGWSELNGLATVQVATWPLGGAWSAPTRLSTADEDVGDPRVAIGTGKSFMAVTWIDNATNTARAATAHGTPTWGAPVTLGNGIWSSSVEVAATLGARARALWCVPVAPPTEAWVPVVSSHNP